MQFPAEVMAMQLTAKRSHAAVTALDKITEKTSIQRLFIAVIPSGTFIKQNQGHHSLALGPHWFAR